MDLFTGGLAELPLVSASVGPTFACIIADQFIRLKKGDRFWYENEQASPYPFTRGNFIENQMGDLMKILRAFLSIEQLKELQKTSLAGILCENAQNLESIQRWPLNTFNPLNPRYSCSAPNIPNINLDFWEEEYYIEP